MSWFKDLDGIFNSFTKTTTTKRSSMSQTSGGRTVSVKQNGNNITINIDGKTYKAKGSQVNMINRDIIIDGKKFKPGDDVDLYDGGLIIKLESDSKVDITTSEALEVEGNIHGDVNCGILTAGDIHGNVTAKGPVSCDNVNGNVDARGPVNCDDVKGDVKASGPINCGDIGGDVSGGGVFG